MRAVERGSSVRAGDDGGQGVRGRGGTEDAAAGAGTRVREAGEAGQGRARRQGDGAVRKKTTGQRGDQSGPLNLKRTASDELVRCG